MRRVRDLTAATPGRGPENEGAVTVVIVAVLLLAILLLAGSGCSLPRGPEVTVGTTVCTPDLTRCGSVVLSPK